MKPEILAKIDAFRASQDDPNFCLVYGSQADATNKATSDVDMMFIYKQKPQNISSHIRFVVGLHKDYGFHTDEEVPYENKIILSYKEVREASSLAQFILAGNEIVIPSVMKEATFLQSTNIKYRLAFNALTGPHIFVGGDVNSYRQFRNLASKSMTTLAIALCKADTFSIPDLVDVLKYGDSGNEGETHLGYKDSQQVTNTLWSNLSCGLHHLSKEHMVSELGSGSYFKSPTFRFRTISLYNKELT